jgi:hypothetical protein
MKFSIGINGYKPHNNLNKRELLGLESLIKLKNLNDVNLYNVIFEHEDITYNNFKTLNKLKLSSNTIIKEYFKNNDLTGSTYSQNDIENNKIELPIVKEIFDVLAATDCDYFIFLNNDIILSDRIFKQIDNTHNGYAASRININDIEKLSETPQLLEYCVHGFDVFVIKKSFWLKNRDYFDNFILGRFYWDTFTATMLKLLGNSKFLNKLPPVCFHIHHPNVSAQNNIENYSNINLRETFEETFENITPNQKNLLILLIYGILIILISDLIIKDIDV